MNISSSRMLHKIYSLDDPHLVLIQDDPVRPEIPVAERINQNSRIYVLKEDNQVRAITCVKFLDAVPTAVDDLFAETVQATIAVFYTIWSYASGSGRTLIEETQRSIREELPGIHTYVTLSPKTEMARRFHLRNGAGIYRENIETINYIYS